MHNLARRMAADKDCPAARLVSHTDCATRERPGQSPGEVPSQSLQPGSHDGAAAGLQAGTGPGGGDEGLVSSVVEPHSEFVGPGLAEVRGEQHAVHTITLCQVWV